MLHLIDKNVDHVKIINRERYDPMVFWVDSIGEFSFICFIDNQDIFPLNAILTA